MDDFGRLSPQEVQDLILAALAPDAVEVYLWSRLTQTHVRVDAMLYSARPVPQR